MNRRTEAIDVLRQARDALARRLIEQVLDHAPDLLDEAEGLTYTGPIEAIHDQIGLRLGNVNQMLGQLQVLDDEPAEYYGEHPDFADESEPNFIQISTDYDEAGVAPPPVGLLPSAETMKRMPESQTADFQSFVRQISSHDLEAAAHTLAQLFEVQPSRARSCAERFHEQFHSSPDFLAKAMQLRGELSGGSVNSALMLLWECFGLQGVESITVMQTLKARLSSNS